MPVWTLKLQIVNARGEIGAANEALAAFLGEHGVESETITTASLLLEESVGNVFRHGLDDDERHEVCMEVTLQEERVILCMEDDGKAFDPTTAPPPDRRLPIEERPIGGLGIHMIRSLTERMEYRRVDERNILTMHLPRPAGDTDRRAPG